MFGDLKVVGLVVLMSSLALIVLTPSIGAKGLIKGGFYKVESRSDNSVRPLCLHFISISFFFFLNQIDYDCLTIEMK